MKYMVVETFARGGKALVYERFRERGRMLPDGLRFIDSWLEKDGDRCFQLMETDSPKLFEVLDQSSGKTWSHLKSSNLIRKSRPSAASKR